MHQVEFPEARIYEETLNCLLYENRIGPDQELMQATSLRVPGPSYTSDDEDDRTAFRTGAGAAGSGANGTGGAGPEGAGPAAAAAAGNSSRSGGLASRLRPSSKHS